MDEMARYTTAREDNQRWRELSLRPGDIVISTPPKAGTTWLQTICALLVFQRAELPAALDDLSPWLDLRMAPMTAVREQLDRQEHRRFIKTHTPLDGVPFRPDVHYVVGARHPLDVSVSTYHQWNNIDLDIVRHSLGVTAEQFPNPAEGSLPDWLSAWIREEVDDLHTEPHSLEYTLWHASQAWQRRDLPNVTLVHYADLSADLEGRMRELAAALAIDVPEAVWPTLVEAAGFGHMRTRAGDLVPHVVPLKSAAAFFREGRSGAGLATAGDDDVAHFTQRVEKLAEPELRAWLLR